MHTIRSLVGMTVLPFEAGIVREADLALGDRRAYVYGRSFVPYLSAEFLRFGASRIALRADDPGSRELRALPPALAARVRIVDAQGTATARTQAFLAPVLAEVPVEFALGGALHRCRRDEEPEVVEAVARFRQAVLAVMVGAGERLLVDLDVGALRARLGLLEARLQTFAARDRVAAFTAILACYDHVLVHTARIDARIEKHRARAYIDLAAAPEYEQMSHELLALGAPATAPKGLLALRRLGHWLQRRLNGAVQLIPTAVAVPRTGSRDVDELRRWLPGGGAFLPPLTSFAGARAEARDLFLIEARLFAAIRAPSGDVGPSRRDHPRRKAFETPRRRRAVETASPARSPRP